jgi:hypothetical protein
MEVRNDTMGEADALRDHIAERGQIEVNQGLKEIEAYSTATMPQENFEMIGVLGDIVMCFYDDCSEDGSEIQRDGIWINIDVTKACWRSAVVILAGPNASKSLTPGTRVCFPNDKGIRSIQMDSSGKKTNVVFLNEERIFGILAPKK